jgi:hypothetical protein
VAVQLDHPDGAERLYTDGRFFAQPDYCENYGRDLITGALVEATEYRAMNPDKAVRGYPAGSRVAAGCVKARAT